MIHHPRSIDTAPHPVFGVYSAGNFAEVAPQRLSPVAWSLIGPPVERANRALVSRLLPRATWSSGPRYVFVGYFACRPYHNLSAYCHFGSLLPGLTERHVTASYFEDAPVPPTPRGSSPRIVERALLPARLLREVAGLQARVTKLDGEVSLIEQRAGATLASNRLAPLGAVLGDARRALDACWDAHYTTTLALVPLSALQSGFGSRLIGHWAEVEPWTSKPDELVWTGLGELHETGGMVGPTAFLERAFYEIADDKGPWSDYSSASPRRPPRREPPAGDRAWDPASQAWNMHPLARSAGLPALCRVVADTMRLREASKSLAMRALHVFRCILPRVAAEAGVPDDDWPYLTVEEIADAHVERRLPERVERRRRECTDALEDQMPETYRPQSERRTTLVRSLEAERARLPRGVSPGTARGVVITSLSDQSPNGDPRILACEAIDADIEPALPGLVGLISLRGSLLSHVSTLAREHGVPAVVGHPLATELRAGQHVTIDGTTGEVKVLD